MLQLQQAAMGGNLGKRGDDRRTCTAAGGGALLHILTPCPACCVVPPAPALQVWVTEKPRTEPTFPGANLWFFCSGGLNFLGTSIDPCIKK